jgi:fused signal recognition particle receptor
MDTAGRMQTSKNLMDEMGKIVRVVKPDIKLFIGDSLAGNDTINQAREFFQYTNFDGAILTKIDADAKGGAAMSIAHITSKPITYVGVGQGYDDIILFDADKFIETLFRSVGEVSVENLMSMPRAVEPIKEAPPEEVPEVEEKEEELPKPVEPLRPTVVAPKVEQKAKPPAQEELAPKPVVREPEPAPKTEYTPSPPPKKGEPLAPKVEEPKEKKGRFDFFGGKKKTDEDRRKEEDEKHKREQERAKEEEERAKLEEEERQMVEKEKEEKKKRKEDKDTGEQEDKVIYLTDEDIEDLLK